MFENMIKKKVDGFELTQTDFYVIIDMMMQKGISKDMLKVFVALDSFGMTAKEVLYLAKALRDSGKIEESDEFYFDKHSTGGVADSSSVVLVPLLSSLGYKIVKTTTESFKFTNGSADRFKSIPNFKFLNNKEDILNNLAKNNACVAYRNDKICPADKILRKLQILAGIEGNVDLMAASIAAKKLSSGAKAVLVDVKYGKGAIVQEISKANRLVKLLKYVFDKCGIKSVIVLTKTSQTVGRSVGNAIELTEAVKTLKGEKCALRDLSVLYATELIKAANPKCSRSEISKQVNNAIDSENAFNQFVNIVNSQGGDSEKVKNEELFTPYKKKNFIASKSGYVGNINPYVYGEILNRICKNTHDNNIGITVNVKIGDYVNAGDVVLTFYYKDEADLERYEDALAGSVRLTKTKIKPINIVRKVIR